MVVVLREMYRLCKRQSGESVSGIFRPMDAEFRISRPRGDDESKRLGNSGRGSDLWTAASEVHSSFCS